MKNRSKDNGFVPYYHSPGLIYLYFWWRKKLVSSKSRAVWKGKMAYWGLLAK